MTENEAIEDIGDFAIGINQEVSNLSLGMAIEALEEIQKYRAIGTLEECRAAMEKQIPQKPIKAYDEEVNSHWCSCPMCYAGLGWEMSNRDISFCPNCGRKLDFSKKIK